MPGILIKDVDYNGEVRDMFVGDWVSEWYATGDVPADVTVINAKGLTAIPAFVDVHVHFRDPGLTEKEDLLSGSRAAAAGGYCSVACEPNTRPVIDTPAKVRAFAARVRELQIPLTVRTKAALTLEQAGTELTDPELRTYPIAGFSDDGEPLLNKDLLVHAFHALEQGDVHTLYAHCEQTPRSSDKMMATLGAGTPYQREPDIIKMHLRALAQARPVKARLHIQHVSMAESVELIANAKKEGLPVAAEVTPHHLLLCEEDIPSRDSEGDANWKMNPPLRTRYDMMAMRRALVDGIFDCIATDHAPHTPVEKARSWNEAPFGVIGLETAFGVCMKLVHDGTITLERLCDLMSTKHNLGANIALIDPKKLWIVHPEKFYSKSRNCPFAGMTLKGKVQYTVANGKLVYAEGKVLF